MDAQDGILTNGVVPCLLQSLPFCSPSRQYYHLLISCCGSAIQVSHAAINELIREAELLGSLRHPNVVWVYGIVLPPVEESEDSGDLDALIDSAEPIEIASAMTHPPPGQGGRTGPGTLRPPAIITEFMSQGSLKGALSRRLEILQPPLMRLMVALDAAKVGAQPFWPSAKKRFSNGVQ